MSGLHVVILAAGKGSRLGALAADRPKWLLDVGGSPIADRQMAAVAGARERDAASLASVRVVTGHADSAVAAYLGAEDDVQLVHNPRYADLNNWYSVLVALRSIPDAGGGVAVINSDLFAPGPWIQAFLESAASTEHEALIAVDMERQLTDESMKVSASGGELEAIGKVGIEDPVGEYVGMLMARGGALARFRETLEGFEGVAEHADEWYERGVGLTAAEGVPWTVWPTLDTGWVEIDDDGDHAAAERLAAAEA
ncbi:MAG TPA: NTP transferase domain-containing protein [Thermoleophilaceae bacterium]|nr:NTP transferase domain-containing protein [Thermoleophilaceae bacterium]